MIRKRNNCKSFQYFLDTIQQYVHYYVPVNLKAKGMVNNRNTALKILFCINWNTCKICMISIAITMSFFFQIQHRETNLCVDGRTNSFFPKDILVAYPCHLGGGPQVIYAVCKFHIMTSSFQAHNQKNSDLKMEKNQANLT